MSGSEREKGREKKPDDFTKLYMMEEKRIRRHFLNFYSYNLINKHFLISL